ELLVDADEPLLPVGQGDAEGEGVEQGVQQGGGVGPAVGPLGGTLGGWRNGGGDRRRQVGRGGRRHTPAPTARGGVGGGGWRGVEVGGHGWGRRCGDGRRGCAAASEAWQEWRRADAAGWAAGLAD